ncbi:hypothetical protein Arub01_34350 [Actinomadura rubrobrunea]|uniref:Uncharacterized protein n=1 Tax=Actinomadura rubrobrunea TaxID=115335 RepID=A0A9W6UV06_9ACTN|nr:hypothetical protein Arub01_34350 [Actinomadura rubrobrunea]
MDAVAAAVGDVAQFLDVHVHQVAGGGVLVAAHGPAGGPVQVGQGRTAVALQHAVHRGGGQAQAGGDAGRAEPVRTRVRTMRRSIRRGVRRGLVCGRLGRSLMPAAPCCRYRSAQRLAVVAET